MRSSFFEFTVANTALFTARGGLDVTGHNIANASTRGYSRQIIEQRASKPLSLKTGKGMVGTGSEIYGIAQIRDFYLDKKYWKNISTLGEYSVKATQANLLETTLDELAGTGLKTQFDDFFGRIGDLSTTAGDNTYRTNLTQLGEAITNYFGNTYQSLRKQQMDINEDIKAAVQIINSKASQIASLNRQITQYELSGSYANDLRDQRARLVDELSVFVNVEVKEVERNEDYAAGMYPEPEDRGKSRKEFIVLLNGNTLVSHYEYNQLEIQERKLTDAETGELYPITYNPEDVGGLYDIYWVGTGSKFNMYSTSLTGELKALIDMRDGNNQNSGGPFNALDNNITYDDGILSMTISPADSRVDMAVNGSIHMVDAGGQIREYFYKDYNYNVLTGEATFTLINPPENLKEADFLNCKQLQVGVTSPYKGIPYYISRLNTLARTFVKALNEGKRLDDSSIEGVSGHLNGYTTDGKNLPTLFFTYVDPATGKEKEWTFDEQDNDFNIYLLNASNIRVNSELLKRPELMQVSDEETGGVDNNKIILEFLKINTDKSLFLEGTIGDYISSMSGELGIDAKQAVNFTKSYTDLSTNIDNQRMSISGVNLDEEMVNMVRYQSQYRAAAKLINVIDEIYDLLINRLGAF